jgi:AraC-like DNA-binding protein
LQTDNKIPNFKQLFTIITFHTNYNMLLYFLFTITGLFGFLTLIIILLKQKSTEIINNYLILVMALVSVRSLLFGISYLLNFKFIDFSFSIYRTIFILQIPSLYLYFKNLILQTEIKLSKDAKHFVLPIIFPFLIIFFIRNSNNNQFNRLEITLGLLCIYVFYYYMKSIRLLYKSLWRKKSNLIKQNRGAKLLKRWTLFLFSIVSVNTLCLLFSIYINRYPISFVSVSDFIWLPTLLWLMIFIKILISPEILYGWNFFTQTVIEDKIANLLTSEIWNIELKPNVTILQDKILKKKVESSIKEYIIKIDLISADFDMFKNPEFSLSDISEKLVMPLSHLNYIFKYHCNMSFSNFKKLIRVQYSINLIESNYLKTHTLDTLAKEVGFASYNPFYTSFKDITGKSPKEYTAEIIKIQPYKYLE